MSRRICCAICPRRANALGHLDVRFAAIEEIPVAPVVIFDRRQAADTIRMLAQQLEVAPQDASVTVVDGRVETTPAISGQALDLTAAMAALEARSAELATNPTLSLSLSVVPLQPSIADVSAVAQEIGPLLAGEMTVALWDPVRDEHFACDDHPAGQRSLADLRDLAGRTGPNHLARG